MSGKRIGVFICRCGGNISDYVEVEKVREAIARHESVVLARSNMFSCSDAAQQKMIRSIRENDLDGIVIASCSPKLHLNTFRAMASRAGLNPYMYTQVNIREQCSWTHTHHREEATKKALRLVRAGVARTMRAVPLERLHMPTVSHVLVIGAGVAGLRAALALSDMGISVHLIESGDRPGGILPGLGSLFHDGRSGSEMVSGLVSEVKGRENITLFTGARLVDKAGSVGNFKVTIDAGDGERLSLEVGGIIVATGFAPYAPGRDEYGYGTHGVVTLPEFKELLENQQGRLSINGEKIKNITYIYCVGSREHAKGESGNKYCSRYCCTAAVHTSLSVTERAPDVRQYHIYKDIRTYGHYETLYENALKKGMLFLRFDDASPPTVSCDAGGLTVRVLDRLTGGEEIEIPCDLVVLVTGMIPGDNMELRDILKIPVGKDGFFNEIHPKLRPVETVMDGIFIAGAAQGPKNVAESVASAMAAAAKCGGLVLKGHIEMEPLIAQVNIDLCHWCGACMEACPYDAVEMTSSGERDVAAVNPALCKGGGACVPVCPYDAIEVKGYGHEEMRAVIDALLEKEEL